MQAPFPREEKVQIAFVEALKLGIRPDWIYLHVPNGGKRPIRTAVELQQMGTLPGAPDLIFIGPRPPLGRGIIFLELKARGHKGRLSDKQIEFRDHVMRCGYDYICTNDLQLAFDDLYDLGVLRHRVTVAA